MVSMHSVVRMTAVIMSTGLLIASPAFAEQIHWGYDDNGMMYIGETDPPGAAGLGQWLCDDGPGSGDAEWTQLGDADGLSDDWRIHGDNSTAGCSSANCADYIEIIETADRDPAGTDCDTAGGWDPLDYGTYLLDIYGDDHADILIGGYGDTWCYGGTGNDWVVNRNPYGYIFGNDGADYVFGMGGNNDRLYGDNYGGTGTGDDCLEDLNDTWSYYDCGAGDDDYANSTGTRYNCENLVGSCSGEEFLFDLLDEM